MSATLEPNTGQNPPGILGRCDPSHSPRAGPARAAAERRHAHRRLARRRGSGVDERTLRRYAQHLTDLGIPIESRRGRYGGYRLTPGYKLPPLMLTDDEAVAVVLGLVAGRRTGAGRRRRGGGQRVGEGAAGAAGRAEPAARRAVVRRRLHRAGVVGEPAGHRRAAGTRRRRPPPPAGPDHLHQLARRLERAAGRAVRPGVPLGPLVRDGFDSLRDEVRTFRLDRVAAAAPGSRHVRGAGRLRPGLPGAVGSRGGAPTRTRCRCCCTPRSRRCARSCRPPSRTSPRSRTASACLLRANRLEWAAAVLAWLGCTFEIEYPEELRGKVLELADRLATCAGR